jgi:hypothetical protein
MRPRRSPDYDGTRERVTAQLVHDFETGPDQVAEAIVKIVEDPTRRFEYVLGREKRYVTLKKLIHASTFDSGNRRHWKVDG